MANVRGVDPSRRVRGRGSGHGRSRVASKERDASWTLASPSPSSSSSLTVCTHAGYFPDDFKPPPDCDMYVAFNAGLPIGDDWRAAAAAVVASTSERPAGRLRLDQTRASRRALTQTTTVLGE